MQLPLKSLWVFEAVARCGSFRIAAEELCVSQSAVSHQIRHLEEWFGKPLFDRTGNRPQLLSDADVLAQELRASFTDIGLACQRMQRDTAVHTLVIAAIPSIAVCWLIPRLNEFRTLYPDIAIRVVYAIHGQKIDFGDVDLAFVFAQKLPNNSGTRATLFMPGTSIPVCSPSLFETLNRGDMEKAILKAGLLHDSDVDGWARWFKKSGLAAPSKSSGMVFEDFNLMRTAALSGQGVALCPLAIIRSDLMANRLIPLSPVPINEDYNYYLIQRESNETVTATAANAFKNWLSEVRNSESPVTEFQESAVCQE